MQPNERENVFTARGEVNVSVLRLIIEKLLIKN